MKMREINTSSLSSCSNQRWSSSICCCCSNNCSSISWERPPRRATPSWNTHSFCVCGLKLWGLHYCSCQLWRLTGRFATSAHVSGLQDSGNDQVYRTVWERSCDRDINPNRLSSRRTDDITPDQLRRFKHTVHTQTKTLTLHCTYTQHPSGCHNCPEYAGWKLGTRMNTVHSDHRHVWYS